MEPFKRQNPSIVDCIDVLSYMVKRYDKDGMDLYYFNSSKSLTNQTDSTSLKVSVAGMKFSGISSPEITLKRILDDYTKKLRAYTSKLREHENKTGSSLLFSRRPPKLPRRLSVYVLTDGVWQSANEPGGEYLEDTIKSLVRELRNADCRRIQVGIQFIRFGNHKYGVPRLETLDRLSKENSDVDL